MKIPALLFLVITLPVMAQYNEIATPGKAKSLEKIPNGVIIKAAHASMMLIPYAPCIIRVRATRTEFRDDFSYAVIQPAAGNFTTVNETADGWKLSTDSLDVIVKKDPLSVAFVNKKGQVLCEDYSRFPLTWQGTEVTSYKKLFAEERFIGLGEKTGNLDRRGEKYVNWNSDMPAYSQYDDPLYVSIPFYMGIHDRLVYGIFLDNSFRTKFSFGASSDNEFADFSAADGEMNYYFFGSNSVAGIIGDYTWLTGRMKLPPYWSLGYHQCRWGYYPESEVMEVAQTFRDKKIPCDALWLDIDYMDSYKIFTWNKEKFPQPGTMIDKLKGMGFHLVTIVDPGIKVEPGYASYDEGVKYDYFVKYPPLNPVKGKEVENNYYVGSVWPGRCHFPDFTKEPVRKWWGASFKALVDPGVEGFWNDMNEPSAWGQDIPGILRFDFDGHGSAMAEAHNVYGLNMARSTFEGTKELMQGKRPFVLTRAGYSGIQRYSAVWTGDNEATEDHLMLGVRLVNSMGLSGIAFAGPDLGGFIGNPSRELFTRWLSVGIYTPFLRNHSVVNSKAKEPWAFGEETEALAIEMLNRRYRLLPYIYSAFYEAAMTGMPVARSLAIDYTFDGKIYSRNYQQEYLFGDNILVAPVVSGQEYCKVYLPAGDWYRLSTGKKFAGNSEVIVESPLDDLPVFVKASGFIPLQSVIVNTAEKPSPTLELNLYNGSGSSAFTYYEDDGITYNYEKGEFYKRMFIFDPADKVIRFSKKEGSSGSKFTAVRLVLHDFGDLMAITVNGKNYTLKLKSNLERTVEFPLGDGEVEIKY
jgi:alpha-glucosidase